MRIIDARQDRIGPGRALATGLPLLADDLRGQVLDTCLLARSVNAVESAVPAPRLLRRRMLLRLASVVLSRSVHDAERFAREVERESRCERMEALIAHLPSLASSLNRWPTETAERVRSHVSQVAQRNAAFAVRALPDGSIPLRTIRELMAYGDANLGMVGRAITELLLAHDPSARSVAEPLRRLAPACGQCLQIVEILSASRGSPPVPGIVTTDVDPTSVLIAASACLRGAQSYVDVLRAASAPRAIVAFVSVPVAWARTSMHALLAQVEAPNAPCASGAERERSWRNPALLPS